MKPPIFAHTNVDQIYPGYINFTPNEDGSVNVVLRGDPTRKKGSFVCGFAKDKGSHGRCVPGDENCNNYCNMAPEKGKMQPHPMRCEQVISGETASMTLSSEAFEKLKISIT